MLLRMKRLDYVESILISMRKREAVTSGKAILTAAGLVDKTDRWQGAIALSWCVSHGLMRVMTGAELNGGGSALNRTYQLTESGRVWSKTDAPTPAVSESTRKDMSAAEAAELFSKIGEKWVVIPVAGEKLVREMANHDGGYEFATVVRLRRAEKS